MQITTRDVHKYNIEVQRTRFAASLTHGDSSRLERTKPVWHSVIAVRPVEPDIYVNNTIPSHNSVHTTYPGIKAFCQYVGLLNICNGPGNISSPYEASISVPNSVGSKETYPGSTDGAIGAPVGDVSR